MTDMEDRGLKRSLNEGWKYSYPCSYTVTRVTPADYAPQKKDLEKESSQHKRQSQAIKQEKKKLIK